MSEITISIKPNISGLAQAFMNANIRGFLVNEVNRLAARVERFGKQLTPVDTGRLRASIATRLVTMNAEVGTRVEYARPHEKDYPFLRPALTDNEAEIKRILHKGLADAMNEDFKGFTKIF